MCFITFVKKLPDRYEESICIFEIISKLVKIFVNDKYEWIKFITY